MISFVALMTFSTPTLGNTMSKQVIEIALGRTTLNHGGHTYSREITDFIVDCKFGRNYNLTSARDYKSEWTKEGVTYADDCTFYTLETIGGYDATTPQRIAQLVESIRILCDQDAVAYRINYAGKSTGYVAGTDGDGNRLDFDIKYFGV